MYKDGKKIGVNIDYFVSGKTKIKEQVSQNFESELIEYTELGLTVSVKHFKNEKPHGLWSFYFEDGKTVQQKYSYMDGKLHGNRYAYYPSGKIKKEEILKFNLLAGPVKSYFENGKPEEVGEYRSNRKHGLFTTYFSTGQIREQGQYVGDKKQGEWKEYDEQGNLLRTTIFKAGILVETRDEIK
jgi:antitoxin component YwqK of YwqJK toxin-antitoxin module